MYDSELAVEILNKILKSAQIVLKRFKQIKSPDDFILSDAGLERFDSICMQLTAIGESLKNLDKVTDNSLLPQYPQVDWKRAKGLRDIISHHYFDLNEEAIYNVCKDNIPELAKTIKKIIEEI